MTTPTPHKHNLDMRSVVSGLETIAFVIAVVLQALGYHSDAIVSALAGATAHGINHQ